MTAMESVDEKNRNAAAGTPEKKNACAIFLCGGSGSRMRGSVADKIFAPLAGTPALAFSLRAFEAAGIFARAVFVFRDEAQRRAICALAEKFSPALAESALFCRGGSERKDSVLNGLARAREAGVPADAPAFIHDCARPLVSAETLRELAALAAREGSAVLAHRCRNTVKRVPADAAPGTACAAEDLDRSRLWETETPQVFPLGKILGAYRKIRDEGLFVTDDAAAAQAAGMPVALAENFSPNPKITVPEDLVFCEALLRAGAGTLSARSRQAG